MGRDGYGALSASGFRLVHRRRLRNRNAMGIPTHTGRDPLTQQRCGRRLSAPWLRPCGGKPAAHLLRSRPAPGRAGFPRTPRSGRGASRSRPVLGHSVPTHLASTRSVLIRLASGYLVPIHSVSGHLVPIRLASAHLASTRSASPYRTQKAEGSPTARACQRPRCRCW